MRTLVKNIIIAAFAMLVVASCDDGLGDPKSSTPVIEAASVSPTTVTFGAPVTLNVTLRDPATNLSNLEYKFVADGRVITSGNFIVSGSNDQISTEIFVPLVAGMPDNTPVTVELVANNVLKGSATREITGLSGRRPAFNSLFLVTDQSNIVVLTPQAGNSARYETDDLTWNTAFNFRIAEKLNDDNSIDFTGAVWGSVNGAIAMIDYTGEAAFATVPNADYLKTFVFDSNNFSITVTGDTFDDLGDYDFSMSLFGEPSIIANEMFLVSGVILLEKDAEYTLYGRLSDNQIIFHVDFFERTAHNKVKFLGETGTFTLNYNLFRQNVILRVRADNENFPGYANQPSHPDYLLLAGTGLGYPTRIGGISKAHTSWGLSNVMQYVLMRKIDEDLFQATIFINNTTSVGFKPYTDTGWGGDGPTTSQFQAYTVTGENVLRGVGTDNTGDWGAQSHLDVNAYYRLTIHWSDKTVNVEKINL